LGGASLHLPDLKTTGEESVKKFWKDLDQGKKRRLIATKKGNINLTGSARGEKAGVDKVRKRGKLKKAQRLGGQSG